MFTIIKSLDSKQVRISATTAEEAANLYLSTKERLMHYAASIDAEFVENAPLDEEYGAECYVTKGTHTEKRYNSYFDRFDLVTVKTIVAQLDLVID